MGFFTILFYIILFSFAYRIIKRTFFPAVVEREKAEKAERSRRFAEQVFGAFTQTDFSQSQNIETDKSGEVEDIEYEEVD